MFSRKLCSVLSPTKRTDKDDTYGKFFTLLFGWNCNLNFNLKIQQNQLEQLH